MGSDKRTRASFTVKDNFNPRSPHGERLRQYLESSPCRIFQSTLPAWGATCTNRREEPHLQDFNPRSPHGERQSPETTLVCPVVISIHAPRMGSDKKKTKYRQHPRDFNPRSPHGERLADSMKTIRPKTISIHAPRMGSDSTTLESNIADSIFQSTLPAWGATVDLSLPVIILGFQSTLPAWGATELAARAYALI